MTVSDGGWFPDLDQQLWIGPVLAILILALKWGFTYAWDAWRGADRQEGPAKPEQLSAGERSPLQPLLVRVCRS